MDDKEVKISVESHVAPRKGWPTRPHPSFDSLLQFPQKLQNCFKSHFKHLGKNDQSGDSLKPLAFEKESTALEISLDKQLQAWKENSNWVDQPPEIKVTVPKGSLCNLNVKVKVGLPPDAIYNIVIDPENKRVFKNIKEVISRRVLVDDGTRQVVEVEQAAIWRFLWLSGVISVHVIVEQNRKNHTVKFKQGKEGFMKKFEGCWQVEPLFIDEQLCSPYTPISYADYEYHTKGKGRVASIVSLDQLIQPAMLPPPPFSWYLRGITAKTTETMVIDLLSEAARLRGSIGDSESSSGQEIGRLDAGLSCNVDDIKERWRRRRNMRRRKITEI